ncbi:MAG: UDP-N-acetylmuramoyl-tripeptide--D-alanyl-D-alanine ligase [Phycisphaeraceae bacterium JB051]
MSTWTPTQLQTITSGTWLVTPGNDDVGVQDISIDSRSVGPGDGFFAIRGERFDGHDFLRSAIEQGASMLIVDRRQPAMDLEEPLVPVLLVDNTVRALQDLARAWRATLREKGIKVIAVTGSNGKTTARRLIHQALSLQSRGYQSPKSFNNHLGVPLTLLNTTLSDRFVVAEVGTNHPGEIAQLADIVRPDVAVITNIGTAHIGHFGSREAIAKEKATLIDYLTRDGLAVIPGDEPLLADVTVNDEAQIVRFGKSANCDYVLTESQTTATGVAFDVQYSLEQDVFGNWQVEHLSLKIPLHGEHNAMNAMLALPVANWECIDITKPEFAEHMLKVLGADMRLEIQQLGDLTLINDAYNANPDSMKAALNTLAHFGDPSRRRIAILGDMLELADMGPAMHEELGAWLGRTHAKRLDHVILVGKLAAYIAQGIGHVNPAMQYTAYPQLDDAVQSQIAQTIESGDIILIKGSRGSALERLIPALTTAQENAG